MSKVTEEKGKEEQNGLRHRVFTVIGVLLCIILIPILLLNITLILKSYMNKEEVPSVGGYLPMIVLTDSMYPEIKSGDLIICHTMKADEVKEGDIISFFDPEGNGTSVVTHRVISIHEENGVLSFRTKGDANNSEDRTPVPAESLVGVYRSRIPGAGNVAMFMQTTPGLMVCVLLPLILLICYDIVRRRIYEKNRKEDTQALLAELEELKREKEKAQEQK